MAAAVAVALLAIGGKALVNTGAGANLGYLSYVSGVIVAAWVAGSTGGLVATLLCALAEVLVFNNSASGSIPTSVGADLRLVLFVVNGVVLALITARLRQTAAREKAARQFGEAKLIVQEQARAAAEHDRAQLARLQTVTASLTNAATPEDVATAILDRGMSVLGALAGVVFRTAADAPGLTVLASGGYPDALLPTTGVYVPGPRSHVHQALAEGRPLFLGDPAEWAERYPDTPPTSLPGSPSGGSVMLLPLAIGQRHVGLAIFRFAGIRDFSDGTEDLAVRLADQGAGALDRALARREEQLSYLALQRAQVRLTFVARVSDLIGARAGFAAGVAEVPRAAVPDLADWCAVGLLDGDRRIMAVAGTSSAAERSVEHLAVAAPADLGLSLAGDAATTGPQVLALDEDWARLADRGTAAVMAELGATVVLIAPILGPSGDRLGSLVLGSTLSDRYGPDDIAMGGDVADRIAVAAERARLFAAVARFKATVDASADAVYMFDPRTLRITYVNRGGADLVGLDPAEVEEQSLTTLLASTDEAGFRQRLADLRASSSRALTFTDVVTQRGWRQIPVDVLLQDVLLPDGSRTAILTARDTSDKIDVQARLARIAGDERRQAAELRAVIQSMGDGVLVVDPDGAISLANEAALGIFSSPLPNRLSDLEEWLGVHDVEQPTPWTQGDEAPGTEAPLTVHLEDGRWLELSTYAADLAGAPLDQARPSRIVVLRDVTRAREAAAAQEAFLGVLSHELRTPITTIFGYAKVLQRPSHQEEREGMLHHIEVESDRLYRIVEDLLALSRVEVGITIEGEPLLIQYLVAPVIASEAPRWGGITFETDLPPDLPVVTGERTYVEQVLRNLMSNAAKYSPPGTTVTVQAEPTPSDVVVRVLDRGVGIDEDEAEHLFGLYYRSPKTARKAAGAGIGLYISRGLITAMGGRIWARPRAGGGSEFGFSLPRADQDLAGPEDDPTEGAEDRALAGTNDGLSLA